MDDDLCPFSTAPSTGLEWDCSNVVAGLAPPSEQTTHRKSKDSPNVHFKVALL